MRILRLTSSCACAVVKSPEALEPQESGSIDVDLNVGPGPRSARLTVESNDPDGSKNLLLSWHGSNQPVLIPRAIIAPNVPLDRPYERTIRLVYPGGKSAIVPRLEGYACDAKCVEVRAGKNDPVASRFTTSGLLTNVLGELELHLTVHPPALPTSLQTVCKLSLRYGERVQQLNFPLTLSFFGGPMRPDVTAVTFAAARAEELLSQERLVRVADPDPNGEIEVLDVPPWLTITIEAKTEKGHLLHLKVSTVPTGSLVQHTVRIKRKGASRFLAPLRVNVVIPEHRRAS